jgi:UDP-galactopyranose mutase
VVNYPNEQLYTRVTEFKYLTGQEHAKTAVVYEYPCDEGDPYYPVPRPENAELYRQYRALAEETPGVHFVGRLATYRYYNMDQVVAQALTTYARIAGTKSPRRPVGLTDPVSAPAARTWGEATHGPGGGRAAAPLAAAPARTEER